MTHYDTLGVSREASADEIKQAYRAKASAAHPDKGGATEDMKAINNAYECLSDAARRAQYDSTGSDVQQKPVEDEARDMLLGAFGSVLSGDGDWLALTSRVLLGLRQQIDQHLNDVTAKRGRLVKRRDRVRSKGENLVHMLIDQQLAGFVRQVEQLERAKRVHACATEMLKAYEADPEGSSQRVVLIGGAGFTGSAFDALNTGAWP